ncbi:MAG TPA: hypothetical protein DCX14_10435 [Flavobacteriales bacterium]|nr:hypothetical protein [Flavobacteriales bacterium]
MNDGKRRLLITGANGLVASQFSKMDMDEFEVVYTSRRMNRFYPNDQFYSLDIADARALTNLLDQVNPAIIIHTAGVSAIEYAAKNQLETHRVNVEAVDELIKWCSNNDARLILFSTDFVFNGVAGSYSELDAAMPMSIYAKSKLQAETLVLNALKDFAIVRTSLVYGVNHDLARLNFPIWLIGQLERGNSIDITEDQRRSPIYALDLAKMTLELAKSKLTGIYHLAGPQEVSVFEFASEVAKIFNLDGSLLRVVKTPEMPEDVRRPIDTSLRIRKACDDLNFSPKNVHEGLKSLRDEILN